MSSPQRNQLIDAAVAALGALVDLRRLGHDEAVRLATEFLLFKLHAALDSGERIRQQIPAAMSSVKQIPLGGIRVGGTFEVDPEARFMLYLLVDSFLFGLKSPTFHVQKNSNAKTRRECRNGFRSTNHTNRHG